MALSVVPNQVVSSTKAKILNWEAGGFEWNFGQSCCGGIVRKPATLVYDPIWSVVVDGADEKT